LRVKNSKKSKKKQKQKKNDGYKELIIEEKKKNDIIFKGIGEIGIKKQQKQKKKKKTKQEQLIEKVINYFNCHVRGEKLDAKPNVDLDAIVSFSMLIGYIVNTEPKLVPWWEENTRKLDARSPYHLLEESIVAEVYMRTNNYAKNILIDEYGFKKVISQVRDDIRHFNNDLIETIAGRCKLVKHVVSGKTEYKMDSYSKLTNEDIECIKNYLLKQVNNKKKQQQRFTTPGKFFSSLNY
jgi:hypothetical protein